MTNQIDRLISSLGDEAGAADEAETKALHAARGVLREAIGAERMGGFRAWIGRRAHGRRGRAVMLFAALAIIGVGVPALAVGEGWIGGDQFAGIRGSAPPQLTGPPVVVASGELEQPWTIVIARSNQGLCLNVEAGDGQFRREDHRLGDCGYSDIRGDLPPDVRGDRSATCIAPAELVPCGSLPRYWLEMSPSGTFVPEMQRSILAGAAAAEVVSVELILTNGGTLDAEVVERPLGPDVPLNVYWAELGPEHGLRLTEWLDENGRPMACEEEVVEMVVARDSEGRVLGRRVPAWNANPTGDPDGQRPPRDIVDECV